MEVSLLLQTYLPPHAPEQLLLGVSSPSPEAVLNSWYLTFFMLSGLLLARLTSRCPKALPPPPTSRGVVPFVEEADTCEAVLEAAVPVGRL